MNTPLANSLRTAARAIDQAVQELEQAPLRAVRTTEVAPVLITTQTAAKLAAVSESTAKQLVLTGQWPSIKIGRARRVIYADLLAWVEGKR